MRLEGLLKIPAFFAAFVLLGLTFGYLTFNILSFSRTVQVPSIVNLTVVEANKVLEKSGLNLRVEGEDYSTSVESGKILRQDIPAGNEIKERRAIRVVVSKGPRVFSVPLLVDKTLNEAETILMQKGLRIDRVISVHSDAIEKGKVVAQRPDPDDRPMDAITVLVSAGPYDSLYVCPDFTDKTLHEAEGIAGTIGLVVEASADSGMVLSQKPKPGTPVRSGDKIHLDVKPEPREAPHNDTNFPFNLIR